MWLTSEEAERCDATTFDPKKGQIYESKFNNRLFNLYRGLQVQPKEGKWSKIKDMLLQNLCNGSEESLEYVLKWSALCVKKPWVKVVTALVFNGPQGSGKGTFSNIMGSFIGKGLHYSHIVNAEHLCGKFNGNVATSLLIVLDECLFPGNHTHASVLKSLLHDEQKLLRQLYKDAVMIPCYDHVIINSNDSFCVKAGKDDRSYAIFTVSNKNQGNASYWDSIYHEISHGGREAFLYHLLNMDISSFKSEEMPQSLNGSRWTMKVHSLSPIDTFLLKILKDPDDEKIFLPCDTSSKNMDL